MTIGTTTGVAGWLTYSTIHAVPSVSASFAFKCIFTGGTVGKFCLDTNVFPSLSLSSFASRMGIFYCHYSYHLPFAIDRSCIERNNDILKSKPECVWLSMASAFCKFVLALIDRFWSFLLSLCLSLHAVGLDHLLAQHMAHLFIRDPVSLFAEKVEQDVEKEMDHFEVRQQ